MTFSLLLQIFSLGDLFLPLAVPNSVENYAKAQRMGKVGVVKAMESDATPTSAAMDNAVGGCKYIFIYLNLLYFL